MQATNFESIIDSIRERDGRYAREAYHFVREALDYTQGKIHTAGRKRGEPDHRHVTGQQLLEGLREYALQMFGPMAYFVLDEWGVHRCDDFGELVFNLVDFGQGMFGKTDQDSREDFKPGYSFEEAFRRPFLPSHIADADRRQLREA